MSDRSGAPRSSSAPGTALSQRCLHLVVLSGLTVAQPLLDLLSGHVETFVTRRLDPLDIVLVAGALLVVPPAPGVLVELVLARSRAILRNSVHIVMIGGYGVLGSLLILRRTPLVSAFGVWALALLGGVLVAVCYARFRVVRSMVSLMAIGLLVVPIVFLLDRDIARMLQQPTSTSMKLPRLECDAPIVFLVFDEFSTLVLLDGEGRINSHRYPNLARISDRATFFRGAMTVAESTEFAVPSIVTGRLPDLQKKPRDRDHPESLFTLFGGSYRIWATEAFTQLCPSELNRADNIHGSRARRWLVLGTDLPVVYLHLVVPLAQVRKLPPIGVTWQGFAAGWFADGQRDPTREKTDFFGRALDALKEDRRMQFDELIEAVSTIEARDLFFAHVLLPHRPWEFLPDRRRYSTGRPSAPGVVDKVWSDSTYLVLQGYQRYMLQTMYLDTEIGRLMDRLVERGWFDRAMIVIVADHGVSFGRGEHTRLVTDASAHELVLVPMIVKEPGQTDGRVVDAGVSTIDLLPTMLDLLGQTRPWPMDGRSRAGPVARSEDPAPVLSRTNGLVEIPKDTVAEGFSAVERKIAIFGDGSDPSSIYRIGPFPELVGLAVDDVSRLKDLPWTAELPLLASFKELEPAVDPVPVFLRAVLSGPGAMTSAHDLAVGVNGRIAATAPSIFEPGKDHGVFVMIPPGSLVAGRNTIELFKIMHRPEGPALRRIELR